jgi:putative ABC transport system ATP-binding protein
MDVLFEYIENNNAALLLVTHDLKLAQRCNAIIEFKAKKEL